jgi:mRNA interferase MazF
MAKEEIVKFVEWTKLKIKIHLSEPSVYCHRGEIWWASLGANIGYEQDGKHENFERPVLILKTFNQHVLWALPLTSKPKANPYYYNFKFENREYAVILSQLRLISSKRLLRKIRILPAQDFIKVRELVKNLI